MMDAAVVGRRAALVIGEDPLAPARALEAARAHSEAAIARYVEPEESEGSGVIRMPVPPIARQVQDYRGALTVRGSLELSAHGHPEAWNLASGKAAALRVVVPFGTAVPLPIDAPHIELNLIGFEVSTARHGLRLRRLMSAKTHFEIEISVSDGTKLHAIDIDWCATRY